LGCFRKFGGDNAETFDKFDSKQWADIVKQLDQVMTDLEKVVESADDQQLAKWANGFDLPTLLPTEVEIARLRLAETVHQEVTSIRARRVGRRIAYRIVDEVLSDLGYRFEFRPRSSSIPLTLGKLIEMIDNAEVFGPDRESFLEAW